MPKKVLIEDVDAAILQILNESACTASQLATKLGWTHKASVQKHLYRLVEKNLVTGWQGGAHSEKVWHTITFDPLNPAVPKTYKYLPVPVPVEKLGFTSFGKNFGSVKNYLDAIPNLTGLNKSLNQILGSLLVHISLRACYLAEDDVVDNNGNVMPSQNVHRYNKATPKPAEFKLYLKEMKDAANQFSGIIEGLLSSRDLWSDNSTLWDRLDMTPSELVQECGGEEYASVVVTKYKEWAAARRAKTVASKQQ